jgi:hypothetical protein
MVNESLLPASPLAQLSGARKDRMPWGDVAALYIEGTKQFPDDAGRRKFAALAAVASGFSANLLRRYAAARVFVDALPREQSLPRTMIDSSFAALELIIRISKHDAELGRQLLARMRDERLTVSFLRGQLKNLAPKSTAGRPDTPSKPVALATAVYAPVRQNRMDAAFHELRRLLPGLSGRSVVAFGKPEGAAPIGIRCDAVAWLDRAFTTGDGFEIVHAPRGSSKAALSDAVSRAMTASSLFRKFYLAFTWDSEQLHVSLAIESLKKFGASTVGVVHFGQDPAIRRKAGKAAPVPDRRDMLRTICPQGRWAR